MWLISGGIFTELKCLTLYFCLFVFFCHLGTPVCSIIFPLTHLGLLEWETKVPCRKEWALWVALWIPEVWIPLFGVIVLIDVNSWGWGHLSSAPGSCLLPVCPFISTSGFIVFTTSLQRTLLSSRSGPPPRATSVLHTMQPLPSDPSSRSWSQQVSGTLWALPTLFLPSFTCVPRWEALPEVLSSKCLPGLCWLPCCLWLPDPAKY